MRFQKRISVGSGLNLDRRTPVQLSNRVIGFNQSKRSAKVKENSVLSQLTFKLKCQCSKINGPWFSCASIELWTHLGSWESSREAREAFGFAPCHSKLLSCYSNFPRASITR